MTFCQIEAEEFDAVRTNSFPLAVFFFPRPPDCLLSPSCSCLLSSTAIALENSLENSLLARQKCQMMIIFGTFFFCWGHRLGEPAINDIYLFIRRLILLTSCLCCYYSLKVISIGVSLHMSRTESHGDIIIMKSSIFRLRFVLSSLLLHFFWANFFSFANYIRSSIWRTLWTNSIRMKCYASGLSYTEHVNILDVILKTVLTPFDIWAEFKWQFVSYVLYIIHSDRKIPLPLAIFILMTWCASLTHLNALLARIARSYDVPTKKRSQALISSLYTDSKWYRSDKTKVGSHTIIFPRMSESCALMFSVETRNSLGKQPKNREKNVAIRLHSAKQDVFCMLNIYNLWLRK